MSIKILLADDHAILRQGLHSLLEKQPDVEVVAEAEDGREAYELVRELLPDIQRLRINGLSPAIGVHGGPKAMLISVKPWVSAKDLARSVD